VADVEVQRGVKGQRRLEGERTARGTLRPSAEQQLTSELTLESRLQLVWSRPRGDLLRRVHILLRMMGSRELGRGARPSGWMSAEGVGVDRRARAPRGMDHQRRKSETHLVVVVIIVVVLVLRALVV